ncbi:unnamed protein product [Coffea canephora]|uniref:Uncharacterized protein n=1 Tax=Coffea canephora TaxID=49390 RepID=A0A068UJM9_COFCA|nr:unnamed protein product [Coffea canephora]
MDLSAESFGVAPRRNMGMLEEMPLSLDPEDVIAEFEAMTRDAGRVQIETLKKILEENGRTEYLQRWGLDGRTDPESYKSCVPLVTHEDLEPYINRIVDGDDSSILTGNPITTISLSSGTTRGMPKFVPFNDELMESTMQIYKTSYSFRNRQVLHFLASRKFDWFSGFPYMAFRSHIDLSCGSPCLNYV